MELTATSRGDGEVFELTKAESEPTEWPEPPTEPIHRVWRRLRAKKGLKFHACKLAEVAKTIGEKARDYKDSGQAILVFVRTIDDVQTVRTILTNKKDGVPEERVELLTGTLRGLERDGLVEKPTFSRRSSDFCRTPNRTGRRCTSSARARAKWPWTSPRTTWSVISPRSTAWPSASGA